MWFTRMLWPPIRGLVCEGLVVQGELHFVDGLRIDASRVVIISGEAIGPIHYDELRPKARIVGDVSYGAIEMHHGASINGELRSLKPADRRIPLAASNDL
jgi:cytoskeletal protein CcmA (bactofilin family)